MKNKICYYTTYGLKIAALKHAGEMGIENSAFANLAINKFLKGDQEINPEFLIKKRTDPDYVARDQMDQIIIPEETKAKLQEVAKRYKCSMAIIVFQAMYDMCFEIEINSGRVQL
ncbi:hypothetical protein ABXS75_10995 [Roseburia hominis]